MRFPELSIHQSVVSEHAFIGQNTKIYPFCVIEDGVQIGRDCIIQPGVHIGEGCKLGHMVRIGSNAVLRENTSIGDRSVFGSLSQSEGNNKIGTNTTIHTCTHITSKAEIGDNVFIGPMCMLINTNKIVHGRPYELELKGPKIRDWVRIGGSTQIKPGVTINRNALIGMGSLVTKDVPANKIAYGRPARIVGDVPKKECV